MTVQRGSEEFRLKSWKNQVVARPAVLMATADIYVNKENQKDKDKLRQCEQALARDSFQLFAGLQGASLC